MLMKCIPTQQGKELLLEIHGSICGHHAALWLLVGKAFRQGFYWPTTLRRRRGSCPHMQGVSVLCSMDPLASAGASDHPPHFAVRGLGSGNGWDSQEGPE
jgi:hypothetical protein